MALRPSDGSAEEIHRVADAQGALLAFRVDGREFAVPLGAVVEVVRYRPPTIVPGVDPAVAGILPLRGRMVTVLDLRRRLGLEPGGAGRPGPVIVAESDGEWLGLIVDAVLRVVPGSEEAAVLDLRTLGAGGT